MVRWFLNFFFPTERNTKPNITAKTMASLLKLDLCCGPTKPEGFFGIDCLKFPGVDLVHDFNDDHWFVHLDLSRRPENRKPRRIIPLDDNTCEAIRAHDAIEHIADGYNLMKEIWRVGADGASVDIFVPSTDGRGAFQDQTHCCYSEDTEILTTEGFKLFSKLEGKEQVFAYNDIEKVAITQPISKIFRYNYSGKMVHFTGRTIDCLVTPNHNMFVGSTDDTTKFRFMTAEKIIKDNIVRRVPSRAAFDGDYPEYFEIPNSKLTLHNNPKKGFISDTIRLPIKPFMEFMGWYLSEGWVTIHSSNESGRYNFYRIGIAQSIKAHPEKFESIKNCIQSLGFSPCKSENGWYFYSKPLAQWLKNLGKSDTKYIPPQLKQMHPDLLQIMLSSMMLGDGTVRKGVVRSYGTYATISSQLASDVQEIAIKCGYRSSCSKEARVGRLVLINSDYRSKHDMYLIYITGTKERYLTNRNLTNYSGKIYCVSIPKFNVILTRRNGKIIWSGNSFWNQNSFGYWVNPASWVDYYRGPCLYELKELYSTKMSSDGVCHVVFKAKVIKNENWLSTFGARKTV